MSKGQKLIKCPNRRFHKVIGDIRGACDCFQGGRLRMLMGHIPRHDSTLPLYVFCIFEPSVSIVHTGRPRFGGGKSSSAAPDHWRITCQLLYRQRQQVHRRLQRHSSTTPSPYDILLLSHLCNINLSDPPSTLIKGESSDYSTACPSFSNSAILIA